MKITEASFFPDFDKDVEERANSQMGRQSQFSQHAMYIGKIKKAMRDSNHDWRPSIGLVHQK